MQILKMVISFDCIFHLQKTLGILCTSHLNFLTETSFKAYLMIIKICITNSSLKPLFIPTRLSKFSFPSDNYQKLVVTILTLLFGKVSNICVVRYDNISQHAFQLCLFACMQARIDVQGQGSQGNGQSKAQVFDIWKWETIRNFPRTRRNQTEWQN